MAGLALPCPSSSTSTTIRESSVGEGPPNSAGNRRSGRPIVEKLESQVANQQPVTRFDAAPMDHPLAVDIRAVAAAAIGHVVFATVAKNLGVLPTHSGRIEHDIAVGMAAENHTVEIDLVGNAWRPALDRPKNRHGV